jgi:hypothetical protein
VPTSPLSEVRGGQGLAVYPATHSLDRDVQNLGGLGHGIKRRLVIYRPLAPLCASPTPLWLETATHNKLLRGILRALRSLFMSVECLRLPVSVVVGSR